MLTQCQKNFARTGYCTLDTTGYYRGKRLNIPEHKMITIRDICWSFSVDKVFNGALP